MTLTTCENCGTEYDTDREPPRDGMDTTRCSSCGKENEPPKERPPKPAAVADGGVPDVVSDVVEAVEKTDGDVHLHVHYHGD